MTPVTRVLSGLVLASSVSLPAYGQSPWLPRDRQLSINAAYTFETFDNFWKGREKTDFPDGPVVQHTQSVGIEYGVVEDLALDVTMGYTWTKSSAQDDEGLADTTFGARWRLIDEFQARWPFAPTVTVRVGGILQGTYATGFPESPGDHASGIETSLLYGKALGNTGVGVYGDVGYRERAENVPDEVFTSVGVYKIFLQHFTTSVGFRHVGGLTGLDIEGPGFNADRFQETREISESLEAGVGYAHPRGPYLGVNLAWTLDGRNTDEEFVVSVLLDVPL
jgi:hypothetical protein